MSHRLALRLVLVALLAGCAGREPNAAAPDELRASEHDHDAHRDRRPPRSNVALACRSGAFVEASASLNSVLMIGAMLPADSDPRVQRELDSLLHGALIQAESELACVQGALAQGYPRAYAEIFEAAAQRARSRGLADTIIGRADALAAQLRQVAAAAPD